jgi:hypothetical protein
MAEMQELAGRLQRVADSGDLLNVALLSGDPDQITGAVDDLIGAYDYYAGHAAGVGAHMRFDQIIGTSTVGERNQLATAALASALADLDVASLLGHAASATGEIEEEISQVDLDEVVTTVGSTARALTWADDGRYGFDEPVIAPKPAKRGPQGYREQVKSVYDTLISESSGLLTSAFSHVDALDSEKIRKGLQAAGTPLQAAGAGRLAQRAVEAAQRAITTLRNLLGEDNVKKLDERIAKTLEELRQGEGAMTIFLKHSFAYDRGQKEIDSWLEQSRLEDEAYDSALEIITSLEQQIALAFTIEKRLINALNNFRKPADWLLKRFGSTIPLDLLLAVAYALILDVALLRAMDYADTTTIFAFVDGVVITSRRALSVGEA